MRLNVFIEDQFVGELIHDAESNWFEFRYTHDWMALPNSFPVSPTLPFLPSEDETPEAHSRAVRTFFENLLPEGQALDDASATYNLSKGNVIGLLARFGQETAGALRILSPAAPGSEAAPPVFRPLPNSELSERIRSRPYQPFSVWDQRVRLSIAGYQDKIAVFQSETNERFLVDGNGVASTHILKPDPVDLRLAGLTSNEFFCMRLAKAAGLSAAEVELQHVPEPILLIKRFDRKAANRRVQRLHAIDGCQALGLSSGAKYERPYGDSRDVREIRTGASLPRLFDLANSMARPASERLSLLRWTTLQVLIGNVDAHAKNLTFLSGAGGLSLGPCYDIVCGLIYSDTMIANTFAMAIGDAFTVEELSAYEWANFCVLTGMPWRLVKKEIESMADRLLRALPAESAGAINAGADAGVIERIGNVVTNECGRQKTIAAGIPEMISYARPEKRPAFR